jgi:hypothetical protein
MESLKSEKILLPMLVVGVAAFFVGLYRFRSETTENAFRDRHLLKKGLTMPTIWLYYNESDVNSRWWADFGARSTRALNLPFLNLCYNSIVSANKANYQIEVISGLSDLAQRLGGWEELPKGLQNPLAPVGKAELNWIRAEVLARWGGLWVHPATICLRPFPVIPYDEVYFYGTDEEETYAGPNGTDVPSLYVVGVGRAEHPMFEAWAQAAFERLEKQGGGQQIRGDAKWDFTRFAATSPSTRVFPFQELSRKADGKRIQLEDLMAAGQEGNLRFKIAKDNLYVPIPWPELQDRRMFGWFLRMSEDQILDSDLAISDLFRATQ